MKENSLSARFSKMETAIQRILQLLEKRQPQKQFYTPKEFAKVVDRKPYTVREWCRLERLDAHRFVEGRGGEKEWRISHEELERYRNEGLLPPPHKRPMRRYSPKF